jgi:hypothetical protein
MKDIPQVIDAMGDKGDCQREHQYRKLAGTLSQGYFVILSGA